jgi:transketolase
MTVPESNPYAAEAALALRVRRHVVRMATGGGCFIGASLSCVDLLTWLYTRVLDVTPDRLTDPARDYLLLSKGHDVPALYGVLAELGYFGVERLAEHLQVGSPIYWHPNRRVPGVEFHSGSLGHLASVGLGIALDLKRSGSPNRVFVVLGDGELDEGSVWEAFLVANAHGLDNLLPVIDRNGFQANDRTEAVIPLEPLTPKLEAFGFTVHRFDGHDWAALDDAFGRLALRDGRRHAFIADTVRGKGLPSIEARADRWFVNFQGDEVAALLRELEGGAEGDLTSPTLHVR